MRINKNLLYWNNLPRTTLKPNNLGKVIRPILETLDQYKKSLKLNNPRLFVNKKRESVATLKYNLTNGQNNENLLIKLRKFLFSNRLIKINGKDFEINEIPSDKDLILIYPKPNSTLTFTKILNGTQFTIEIESLDGVYLEFDVNSSQENKALKSIFKRGARIKIYNKPRKGNESRNYYQKDEYIWIKKKFIDEDAILAENNKYQNRFQVTIEPNIGNLNKKMKALLSLIERPKEYYFPLLRLFEKHNPNSISSDFTINNEIKIAKDEWQYLNDETYPGVEQQQKLVEIALNTPDFAILEGPPGSGKTTTILEIMHQATKRNMKVLMVASTHVAVDNVLEGIHEGRKKGEELHIFPLRIGRKEDVIGVSKNYLRENIAKMESNRIIEHLKSKNHKKMLDSQKDLINLLETDEKYLDNFLFEIANVVCGTTIGILQFPAFKMKTFDIDEPFDILIIDEASKTTFQEFLVPALMAKKWIIIGDKMQLPPFIEEGEVKVLSDRCQLENNFEKDHESLCSELFVASKGYVVITDTNSFKRELQEHVKNSQIDEILLFAFDDLMDANDESGLKRLKKKLERIIGAKGIIIDYRYFKKSFIRYVINSIPPDFDLFISKRIPKDEQNKLKILRENQFFQSNLYEKTKHKRKFKFDKFPIWVDEISWRLKRIYELRHQTPNTTKNSILNELMHEVELLIPKWSFKGLNNIEKMNNLEIMQITDGLMIKSFNLMEETDFNLQRQMNESVNKSYDSLNLKDFFKEIKEIYDILNPTSKNLMLIEIIWLLNKVSDTQSFLFEFYKNFKPFFQDLITFSVGNKIFDSLRIEFPSIIELLQEGLMVEPKYRNSNIYNCTIYKGYEAKETFWRNREIKLEYQHRMHPEISEFIRENFYNGKQVRDPDGTNGTYDIEQNRNFPYRGDLKHRNIWINVAGKEEQKGKSSPWNIKEVDKLFQVYCHFENWAEKNPKPKEKSFDDGSWSVAIITFYTGQENKLSERFKSHFKSSTRKYFTNPNKNIKVRICSVDRFQGQEADVVFISFVRTKKIGFLDSVNRLNVALSRAKYFQVLVGDKDFFKKEYVKNRSPILYKLTKIPSDIIIEN